MIPLLIGSIEQKRRLGEQEDIRKLLPEMPRDARFRSRVQQRACDLRGRSLVVPSERKLLEAGTLAFTRERRSPAAFSHAG
jgi:hypothetical protein